MAPAPNHESAARNRFTVLGLAALLSLLNVSCGASAQPNHARQQEQGQAQPTIYFVRNPDPAPEFMLAGLDGKPISLAAARGKIILLNFWASWCGPCRAEVPDLVELQERYKDRLQVIGLIVDDDDMDAIHQFVRDFGINYPVGVAPVELRVQYGGIPGLPTSFVLDTQGRVVQKHVGLRDPALYEIEIRALLGLPTGFKVETFEDTGEIFLKHADRASELPGVDFSKLTAEQKKIALHRFNAESCNCGCTLTLAQCRINDSACQVSKSLTAKIIGELTGTNASARPAKSAPAAPAQPNASVSPAPSDGP
jgi:cytochrome c biogenesis protein CcmG/thiol:disulfide interchange protein DsbE